MFWGEREKNARTWMDAACWPPDPSSPSLTHFLPFPPLVSSFAKLPSAYLISLCILLLIIVDIRTRGRESGTRASTVAKSERGVDREKKMMSDDVEQSLALLTHEMQTPTTTATLTASPWRSQHCCRPPRRRRRDEYSLDSQSTIS